MSLQGWTDQKLRQRVVGNVRELGTVVLRNDKLAMMRRSAGGEIPQRSRSGISNSMSLAQWPNVEEGQSLVALEELEARNLSCESVSEQATQVWSMKL